MRRAQRSLSRRKPGSGRHRRARRKVAYLYRHICNQRADFIHKLTAELVRKYEGVCIEDLALNGMLKTKAFSRSFRDAAFGEFRKQLEYKSLWYRKHFIMVGRFFPSSKTCNVCGAVNDALTLADREWTCPDCGSHLDRDYNAALNIRAEGLRCMAAGYADINARRACVRPLQLEAMGAEA